MLLILALYAVNPSTSNPFYYCIFLAYPLDTPAGEPVQYGKGKADFAFVAFYTIVLSFTREFLMQRMIRPLAIRLGILRKAKQARFMEQFYTAMYFAIFGPFGLYVMRRSPVWYFNTNAMFEGFPHRTHEAVFKAYYLLQASYWAQQAIVLLLMLEKPRKDFKELVLHHVVTLALIWLSYRFHFTYMGIAVYITMDISDFFLAVSFLFVAYLSGSISC
jgi:acyl-CoA-dependent ceramide synthase